MNHNLNQWADIPVRLNELLIQAVYRAASVIIITGCVFVTISIFITAVTILVRFLDLVIGKPKGNAEPSPGDGGDQNGE